jgi:hypothetical protein
MDMGNRLPRVGSTRVRYRVGSTWVGVGGEAGS